MENPLKTILNPLFSFFITFSFINFSNAQIRLEPYWKSIAPFDKPVGIVHATGLDGNLFIFEQRGTVYKLDSDPSSSKRNVFLELSSVVSQSGFETGLLGLAFHPGFSKNGRFFLSYTTGQQKELTSHIVEMQVSDNKTLKINPMKTKDLITVSQPYENHNGGALVFGPDGFLYFAWGDGGSGGDPQKNGQNLNSLLGKIHRIDVDHKENGLPYSIPKSNPFQHVKDARPEIFAYGLRNVWQMNFDSQTGKLWAGDVGQNAFEEIDVVESGKNYGWRYYEANSEFKPADPKPKSAIPPVWNYTQKNGDKSVTGGYVYHGPVKEWDDGYIYGDFITGRLWIYYPSTKSNELLIDRQTPPVQVTCFGKTKNADVLIASYEDGVIYKMVK